VIDLILSILLIVAIAAVLARMALITTEVVQDHETALHYRHGKFVGVLAPGRHRLWGRGHVLRRFDKRRMDLSVQGQEFLTADKAGIKVTAVVEYRIADALRFQAAAVNPLGSLYHSVQIALRHCIGGQTVEAALEGRANLAALLMAEVKPAAESLGLVVETVAVKDLMIGGELKRVFIEGLTARQESLVTLEKARAEAAAIRTLANAARVFESHPALLQLKFLQALERAEGGVAQPLMLGTAGHWLDFLKK
jgi:regulator of protease activity HflC (stomatin/prohibitin superfamily)